MSSDQAREEGLFQGHLQEVFGERHVEFNARLRGRLRALWGHALKTPLPTLREMTALEEYRAMQKMLFHQTAVPAKMLLHHTAVPAKRTREKATTTYPAASLSLCSACGGTGLGDYPQCNHCGGSGRD